MPTTLGPQLLESPFSFPSPSFSFACSPLPLLFLCVLTTFLHPSAVLSQRQKVFYPCLWDWINPSSGPPTSILDHWAQPLNSAWGDYASLLSVFPLTCFLQLPYRSPVPLMPETLRLPLFHLCRSTFLIDTFASSPFFSLLVWSPLMLPCPSAVVCVVTCACLSETFPTTHRGKMPISARGPGYFSCCSI